MIKDFVLVRGLSLANQRRLPVLGALALCLGLTAVFVVFWGMTGAEESRLAALRIRAERITPLVNEVLATEAQRPQDIETLAPLAAAQKVTRDLGLEAHLTSVRPSQLSGGQESVTLVYESLDLPKLIGLLQGLQQKGGLALFSAALTRRLDDRELADLQLVLAK